MISIFGVAVLPLRFSHKSCRCVSRNYSEGYLGIMSRIEKLRLTKTKLTEIRKNDRRLINYLQKFDASKMFVITDHWYIKLLQAS